MRGGCCAVVGHLVDTRDLPRWVHVWGAITYGLVPATSGAWGEGRFGTVAVAALLPWTARAALGFADPDRDGRWRAAWRTALLVALGAAFVPGVWLFALLVAAIVFGAAAFVAPRLLKERDAWGPPVAGLLAVPVLLAPWLLPLITTGSAPGLLLEAGRLPGDRVDFVGLVTGRLGDLGAPWWLGALLAVLAVLALVPTSTRVPVIVCWLVALAAALVAAVLGYVRPVAARGRDTSEPGPVRGDPPRGRGDRDRARRRGVRPAPARRSVAPALAARRGGRRSPSSRRPCRSAASAGGWSTRTTR